MVGYYASIIKMVDGSLFQLLMAYPKRKENVYLFTEQDFRSFWLNWGLVPY